MTTRKLLGFSMLCWLAVTLTAHATPSTVYVNAAWTGPTDCGGHTWQIDAFPSIQAGIDAVADGGTVQVSPGTYAVLLQIVRPVTILGPGGNGDPLVSAVVIPPSAATATDIATGFYAAAAYPVVVSGFILSEAYIAATSGH